tara:strand:- start:2054 stop:4873 length:2820 start_codon:yes stop_codon:yes gene_type:complete
MFDNFTKTFNNKKHKDHKKDNLMDLERAKMPATMPYIEKEHENIEISNAIEIQRQRIELMEDALRLERHKVYLMSNQIRENEDFIKGKKSMKIEKREFIKACPAEGCKGFLSTSWKCGACSIWVCKHCEEIIGKDKNAEHVCDDNKKKSIAFIKKSTKPCPSCGTSISKISGCFEKGTKIMLWNGKEKLVENIVKGDELIGTDGNKRTVLETLKGKDKLYNINQNNGMNYTVNSRHDLILKPSYFKKYKVYNDFIKMWWVDSNNVVFKSRKIKYTQDNYNEKIEYVKTFMNSIKETNLKITVDDYIKLKKHTKSKLYGFKSTIVNWKHQDIDIDPYIVGTWLGDGYSDGSSISSNDNEIIEKWMNWCENNDGELVHTAPYRFSIRRRGAGYKRGAIGEENDCKVCKLNKFELCSVKKEYIKTKKHKNSTSPLKDALKKYNLLNNKHIPDVYLMNSEENRLKLLAGIIDTDGCVSNNGKRITIIQVNKHLSNQICVLARSLGFLVKMSLRKKLNVKVPKCEERKDYKSQYNINISGTHLNKIPTILKRKKCINSNPNKDYFKSSIKVEYKSYDEYYGFRIDGNNEFILPDFTSVKNCDQMWCTGCKVAFSWNTGRKINGTIHNPHYYEYMQRSNTAGHVNQQPGAILCGGLPYHQYFVGILTECLVEINGFDKDSAYCLKERIMSLYRISGEIRENILDKYREDIQNNDNLQYRIRFIKKEIDEKDFKKNIMRKKKSLDFKQEVLHIYELFNVVLVETVRDIYESLIELPHQKKETVSTRYDRYYGRDVRRSVRCREIQEQHVTGYINKLVEHFNKVNDLALYCNDELFKISTAYNLQVLVIPDLVNNPTYLKVKNNMLDVKESAKQVFDAENIFLWCKHRGPYCRDTRGYKSTGKYKEKFPNFNPVIREFYESENKRWEEKSKQKDGSWVGRPNILNLL